MIEGIKGKGVNRANAICDDCGKTEAVSCGYIQTNPQHSVPNKGQVLRKVEANGWAEVKGKLRCPECEAKRKEANMTTSTKPKSELREPTPKQKREIIGMLEIVYDDEAKRFKSGESDKTVADAIGDGVLWGWVAQIREELFGPDTRNKELDEIRKGITDLVEAIERERKDAAERIKSLEQKAAHLVDRLAQVSA